MFPSSSELTNDPEPSPRRRSLAIAVTILIVVMVGSVGALALLISNDRETPSRSGATPRSAATATSTQPPTTTTTAPPTRYEVRAGDSLSGIARRFGVSVVRLATVNGITDADVITPHQVLRIPRVRLAVDPVATTAGGSVSIRLTGAGSSETVTFEVDSPTDSHTGAPHVASPEGVVTATYRTAADDPVGTYTVTARGGEGTRVEATFAVQPPTG